MQPDTSLPLPPTIRQIDALQLLRGVAVLLVIWCHTGQVLADVGAGDIPSFGAFGIDIFFVISGFILSLSILREHARPGLAPMGEFLKRRFIRIYPIYWFVALITMARLARSNELAKHSNLAAFFLLSPLHPANARYIVAYSWTLNFEVFFYLLLGLILLKTIHNAVPALILILVSFCAIGSMMDIRHPVLILAANPILLEFVFGAVIALLYARIGRRRPLGIGLVLLGTAGSLWLRALYLPSVATGAQMVMRNQGTFRRVATWGVCATLLVGGFVLWSPAMNSLPGKLCVLLGNASYASYLVSAMILEFAHRLFFKLDPPSPSLTYKLVFATTMLATVTAAGFSCYFFIERPMLRVLQNALLHKPPVKQLPSSVIKVTDPTIVGPSNFKHP